MAESRYMNASKKSWCFDKTFVWICFQVTTNNDAFCSRPTSWEIELMIIDNLSGWEGALFRDNAIDIADGKF